MLTTIVLALVAAPTLTLEEAKDYFPLNPGDKWVYEQRGDEGSMRVTDTVGEQTILDEFECIPVITTRRNQELDRVYYYMDKDEVKIVAFNKKNPLVDPYTIFRMPERGSKWSHIGDTMMGDAPADLDLKASVKRVGKKEFNGEKYDAIEVKLTAKLLEKLGTPFTVKQVAIYGKGIGLLSMEMETILPRRRIKMTRKLVTYTPNTK